MPIDQEGYTKLLDLHKQLESDPSQFSEDVAKRLRKAYQSATLSRQYAEMKQGGKRDGSLMSQIVSDYRENPGFWDKHYPDGIIEPPFNIVGGEAGIETTPDQRAASSFAGKVLTDMAVLNPVTRPIALAAQSSNQEGEGDIGSPWDFGTFANAIPALAQSLPFFEEVFVKPMLNSPSQRLARSLKREIGFEDEVREIEAYIAGTDNASQEVADRIEKWSYSQLEEGDFPTGKYAEDAEGIWDYIDPERIYMTLGHQAPLTGALGAVTAINPQLGVMAMAGAEGGEAQKAMDDWEHKTGEKVDKGTRLAILGSVGAINAALEKVGIEKILKGLSAAPTMRKRLMSALSGWLWEGGTESLQEAVHILGQLGYDDQAAENALKRIGESAYGGLIVGGFGSTLTGSAGYAKQKWQSFRAEKAQEQLANHLLDRGVPGDQAVRMAAEMIAERREMARKTQEDTGLEGKKLIKEIERRRQKEERWIAMHEKINRKGEEEKRNEGYFLVDHYSMETELESVDPDLYGSMYAGAERKRDDDPKFKKRSYYYLHGAKPKMRFDGLPRYEGMIKKSDVYDVGTDPDNLLDGNEDPTDVENKVLKAGYKAITNSRVDGSVIMAFEKKAVRAVPRTGDIILATLENNGHTVNINSGKVPTSGYTVSTHEDLTVVVPSSEFTDDVVREFMRANRQLLAKPGKHLSTWVEEKTGDVYLDVIDVEKDRKKAIELGRKHNQIAIYEIGDMSSPVTTGTGKQNADFFTGKAQKRSSDIPYEPVLDVPKDTPVAKDFDVFTMGGNFTSHISKMIPGFAEKQQAVAQAIVDSDAKSFLDIGTSEGGIVKTVAKNRPDIKATGINPNPSMRENYNKTPDVPNAEYRLEALGASWVEDDGTRVERFSPSEKYDVINEDYTFQFINNDKKTHVGEVVKVLSEDGVFVTSEKFFTDNYEENEKKKLEHQSKYFNPDQLTEDKQGIVTGMADDMVTDRHYLNVLNDNFKYVVEFWNAGNFKGYMASNSKEKLDQMLSSIGDMNSEYSEYATPRWWKDGKENNIDALRLIPTGGTGKAQLKKPKVVAAPKNKNKSNRLDLSSYGVRVDVENMTITKRGGVDAIDRIIMKRNGFVYNRETGLWKAKSIEGLEKAYESITSRHVAASDPFTSEEFVTNRYSKESALKARDELLAEFNDLQVRSDLDVYNPVETRGREFKSWHRGSKVRGIAFHGTGLDFNDFTIEKSDGEHGSGFYFDSTQEIAEGNSGLDDGSKGSVVPAYLSVKKPAIYSGSGQTVWGERSHPKLPQNR
jgi:SAM-dependent methyltransferase